ncbi:hypothetical protein [Bradyrhizobium sp. RDM4]|uniref:hypothetical protein n=1 Tax=Bradyrhizobium sp. RDM4 TaxID=3378765 RepID=UPI0038FC052F
MKKHVAKPLDGDNLKIVSAYLPRVQEAIDTFWNMLAQIPSAPAEMTLGPRWYREWMENPTDVIDLDAAYARGAC